MTQGDNQQATPSEAEIAWLAGLIEGDGTLALSAHQRTEKQGPKIAVTISIYNTDAAIISKSIELLTRLSVGHYLTERQMKPMLKPGGAGAYHSPDPMLIVQVKKFQDALALLARLRPWLFGEKSVRADLMLRFLARRLARIEAEDGNTRVPYSRDDLNTVREFYTTTRKGTNASIERVLND